MYNYKTKPLKHQLEALAKSATKKNFAYFMEMGCFEGETEVLTNRGWIRFKDIDIGHLKAPFLIAQAVPNDKKEGKFDLEFVEPISFIKKETTTLFAASFMGRPIRSYNKNPDILCTPDHLFTGIYSCKKFASAPLEDFPIDYVRQVAERQATRKPFLPFDRARIRIPRRVTNFLGFNSDWHKEDVDLAALSEHELRVQVAVMADGTFPNKFDNKCDMYFIKERKADRIEELLNKAGIPFVKEKRKRASRKEGRETLYVYHFMAPIKTKEYTEEWYTLPYDKLRIIATEVMRWDGTINTNYMYNTATFYAKSKESADFIQYVFFAVGCYTTISEPSGPEDIYEVRVYGHRSPPDLSYEIFGDRGRDACLADFTSSSIACEAADGRDVYRRYKRYNCPETTVYCFRVPSGYLWLRRNGAIYCAHNSGKTKVMIDNTAMLYQKGAITGCLVLAPKGVYKNWSDIEIPKHLPDDIQREVLVWDAAKSPGYKKKLHEAVRNWDHKKLQFLVFNVESLISEKGKDLIIDFIRKHDGNVMALVDESTCIKNHKAKRTKVAIEIGKKCKARRIATGSPITNTPLDLYSQCAFLDKKLLGFGSYYAFKNTFANVEKIPNRNGQYYEKILSYKNLDRLSEMVAKFSHRVTKKECLDLPDKIYMTRDVELTDEQKKIYNEMAKYQFALMQDGESFKEMSVSVVLTKFLRLHQILCGTFTTDDGELKRIPNHRLDALQEVLDETSGKVIIWATYIADIEAISEMLKKEYGEDSFVTYYGATSADDRTKAIERFQDESSPVRFFLGNTQTAGRGITLTAANTVVYYSNNFSLELRQQSEDRAHRFGQKNPVTYVDLVVRNSLDEKIIQSLINKRDIANEVLKDDLTSWITLEPSQD